MADAGSGGSDARVRTRSLHIAIWCVKKEHGPRDGLLLAARRKTYQSKGLESPLDKIRRQGKLIKHVGKDDGQ